jgi:hypothetical protein
MQDPRLKQFDFDYNDENELTEADYEDFAAWDIHDYADEMRSSGEVDVPKERDVNTPHGWRKDER